MFYKKILILSRRYFIGCFLFIIGNFSFANQEDNSGYYLQISAFNSSSVAKNFLKKNQDQRKCSGLLRKTITNGKLFYQVQLGPFKQLSQAQRMKLNIGGGFIRFYPNTSPKTSVPKSKPQRITHPKVKAPKLSHSQASAEKQVTAKPPQINPGNNHSLPIISYPNQPFEQYDLREGHKLQFRFDL